MAIPEIVDFDAAGLATVTGPLSSLYENSFKLETYSYPRNLGGDPTRKHVIEFAVQVPRQNYSPTAQSVQAITDLAKTAAQTFSAATESLINDGVNPAIGVVASAGENIGKSTGAAFQALTASDVKRDTGTIIRLYVPDTVNVQYSAGYDDLSLAGVLGKPYFIAQAGVSLFDKYKNSSGTGGVDMAKLANSVGDDPFVRQIVGNFLGGADAGRLLTGAVGQALNPQMQVIFSSVGFRTFQFDFTLTPYSQEEAIQIKKIVEAFKMAGAPEIQKNPIFGQGMFFKVPDRFQIRFLYNGRRNENVHRIAECVLENIAVDYAPIGWATFGDGNPVQTKLTLQFKEVEIIDKTRIKQGF
jgi:hypothetical protein